MRLLPTTDADWVSDGIADQAARRAAMERHPSWPTTGQLLAQEQQVGVELLLANAGPRVELDPFEENASEVFAELLGVLVAKQADYGPRAINDSPGGALNGINVRMHDKLSRVVNLTQPGRANHQANYESLRDTYADVANYAAIAVMVLDGTWPR